MTSSSLFKLPSEGDFYIYLKKVNSIPSLSAEEEISLARKYIDEKDVAAGHQLVLSYLKLVAKIALSFKYYGLPLIDMVSEGNIGLITAVQKYNPDLGYRLSTYAMWWIKASIQEYVFKSWSLIKIGTTATHKKLFFSLNKIKNKLRDLYCRSIGPSDYPEIANELELKISDVAEMDGRMTNPDISLNQTFSNSDQDNSTELMDYIPSPRPSQDVIFEQKMDLKLKKELLFNALGQLNERDLYIFKARNLTEPIQTLEDLSKKFSISKERIRQIESRVFKKVQSMMLTGYHYTPPQPRLEYSS